MASYTSDTQMQEQRKSINANEKEDANLYAASSRLNHASIANGGAEGIIPNPVKKIASITLLVGVVLLGIAVGGLFMWLTAAYFHDPGPYPYNSWHGYDVKSFWGLMLFMVGTCFGFVLTYIGVETLARTGPTNFTVFLYAFFGSISVEVGCVGLLWGRETMKCLGVFCVGTSEQWHEVPNLRPEAGIGFLSTIGTSAFLSMVPIGLVAIYAAFYYWIRNARGTQTQGTTRTEARPLIDSSSERSLHILSWEEDTNRLVAIGAGLFSFIFFFGLITLYIPNSWEYFTAARIAKNARLVVTQDLNLCVPDYNRYTCSEVSWATFFTKSVRASENLVLKFYPGNVFFFTYLLALIAFIVVIRYGRGGRLWVKRAAFNFSGYTMTYGEVIVTIATIVMCSAFFHYWIHDHNYNGYWQGGENRGLTDSERWARALGQLAVVFMGLLFFPASRNSVLHKLFGTSWEASLWAHRVLGYLMLAASFSHMVAWYVKYGQLKLFPKDIFEVPMSLPTSIDNFTVPMNTLTTWLLFLCMGVFALEPIRRKSFELFYYSHLAAAYLAIPAVLWHAAAGWEYLLPGVTIWFIDRLVRVYRSSSAVDLVDVKVYGNVTELRFTQKNLTVAPGQYVFLNIPEVSVFQWHPFTISSSVSSSYFSVHIKSMGPGTWTDTLNKLAADGRTKLSLAVDGPYGHAISYADYKRVILVAGGIGITPAASIFAALKNIPDITAKVVWSCRDVPMIASLTEQLSLPAKTASTVTPNTDSKAHVFVTCRESSQEQINSVTSQIIGAQCARGRPSISLAELAEGAHPDEVLVFVCGPEGLVWSTMKEALDNGFHFHRETFLL